jgi:UDP-N-acetylmuramoyl-tripeptide--D-alanyl-D-alanine ligase
MTLRPAGSHRVDVTAGFVADACRGALVSGSADTRCDAFSIDTRTLTAGGLFFAIPGPRFDGNRFAAAALEAGASGVVVSDRSAVPIRPTRAAVILVGDTIRALQDLAQVVRRASGTTVVAVSGSAGKTTTKEVLADLLAARFDVFRSHGNFNNHIGLPLSLLHLRNGHDIAVVELGMNHAGELRVLTAIAEPDVRVWTLVAEVHQEFFSSIEDIADAKAEILDNATPETLVVANAADARVMTRVRRCPARVVTFGIDVDADVSARDVVDDGVWGTRAMVTAAGGRMPMVVPLIGRGHLANVLAAAAVALEFGIALREIAERVGRLVSASRRGEVRHLRDGVTVIDDSYNSNPRALEQMLEAMAAAQPAGRRVAVLGEMLELGDASLPSHRECGRAAAKAGLAALVTVGGEAALALGEAAIEAGMPASAVTHAPTSEETAGQIDRLIRAGDLVLVKGSHGIKTEIIADRIAAWWA